MSERLEKQKSPHAQVVGIGAVGGSIAAGLRARSWYVTGSDDLHERETEALERGIIDKIGLDNSVDITIIATPVSSVVDLARAALRRTTGFVTDVASVKGDVVDAIIDERFVGGHPMAGSEQSGLAGVDADLFEGAAWVLTTRGSSPSDTTSGSIALAAVRTMVETLGAFPIEMDAHVHDKAVATISHLPHLAAAMLMGVASTPDAHQDATLQLAAGGFRDMTRIAAGDADLWSDIIFSNKKSVLRALGTFIEACTAMQNNIENDRIENVTHALNTASLARRVLPERKGSITQYAVVHVPIPDRPGALAAAIAVFSELQVNVEDLGLSHDPKGDRGTLSVTVAHGDALRVQHAMHELEIHVAIEELTR